MRLSWLNIPAELRTLKQWSVATLTRDAEGKQDKTPRHPRTGNRVSSVDPLTWTTFEECINAGYPAIGFMLAPSDPFTIIDLDYKEGVTTQADLARHKLIREHMPSYTERSVNGAGLHIILRGKIDGGVRRDCVEVYDRGRFMICTGDVVAPGPIQDHSETLGKLVFEMGGIRDDLYLPVSGPEKASDDEIIARASNARNGAKFLDLFYRRPEGSEDWSLRDAALAQIICFYTKNHNQALRIFRRSALYRPHDKGKNPQHYEEYYLLSKTFGRAWNLQSADEIEERADLELGKKLAGQLLSKPEKAAGNVTFPPGLVGEIANYIFHAAQRPVPEIALAGALVFCAGLFGRQYNINRTGLNLYLVLVAGTGRGKEGVASGIDALSYQLRQTMPSIDEFRGPARIASGQALLRALSDKPCMFSILGEFGHTLQSITDDRASSADVATRQVLLDLFSKSGQHQILQSMIYSDKDKNTEPLQAPAYSFLGDTTPESYYAGINSQTVAEGLIPRFMTITYTGPRVPTNKAPNFSPDPDMMDRLKAAVLGVMNLRQHNRFIEVRISPGAARLFDEYDTLCDKKINARGSGADAEMWNRAHLKLMRLAALVAVGVNASDPTVQEEHVVWARALLDREMTASFEEIENNSGAHENRQLRIIREAAEAFYKMDAAELIHKYRIPKSAADGGVIPLTYFRRRLNKNKEFDQDRRGFSRAIKESLRDCVEEGLLQEVSNDQKLKLGHLRGASQYYVLGENLL